MRGSSGPRLIVVGDYAWDVLIRTNSQLLAGGDTFGEVGLAPGGSAANVAVWARRCGAETTFVGKIGRDRLGDLAIEDLEDEGVRHRMVRSGAQATGSVAVWIDHTGQRSMVSGKGADHYLLPSELPRELLSEASHLHLTAWSFFANPPRSAAREAARVAKAAGATVSLDPASFQMIEAVGVDRFLRFTSDLEVDLLFPNHEEGTALTGETDPERILAVLAERYPSARPILKLDAEGALVRGDDGVPQWIPPAASGLLDATGAGDAFAGAFLARWLAGEEPAGAARFATRISAWTIEQLGARPKADARLEALLAEGDAAPGSAGPGGTGPGGAGRTGPDAGSARRPGTAEEA